MGRFILKLIDPTDSRAYYLEWSTIVDAPVTCGMSLDEFKKHYKAEYGRQGMAELERRLDRVEAKGTSSYEDESVEDSISCNRAGPDETEADLETILDRYCRNRNAD